MCIITKGTQAGQVPNANWNTDNGQLNLNANNPDNSNSDNGVRSTVSDLGKRLKPAAEHFTNLGELGLSLEDFRFVDETKFEEQSKLKHGYLQLSISSNQIIGF